MNNTLVKLLGWKATVLHGDTFVVDRWYWLKRHLQGGQLRTFDAGCGNGWAVMWAAKQGNEAVGLNFDEPPNRGAELRAKMLGITGVSFKVGDLRELDRFGKALGAFDQIICTECIEHILNDQKLVDDLASMLKPGGKLMLTAPYKHHKSLVDETMSGKEDGGHVRWGYTHEELRKIFTTAGLEVVSEEYISGFIAQQLTNLARRFGRTRERMGWAFVFPLRCLKILDAPVTRMLRFPHLSVGLVGIKPAAGSNGKHH
jgi:2-polyprenyl-3-methyl-5-hydroxy-6-metoxy-1,4-benzoquinol methylase